MNFTMVSSAKINFADRVNLRHRFLPLAIQNFLGASAFLAFCRTTAPWMVRTFFPVLLHEDPHYYRRGTGSE
jgi:hypothetical protein